MTVGLGDLPWRRLAPAIFAPAFLFSIGRGAVLPVFAVFAAELGADLAIAGLVVAATLLGELVGNLPSGWLVHRVGERAALAIGAATGVIGSALCLFAPSPVLLVLGALVLGLAASTFAVARITFMAVHVPLVLRGRAMSALAGANRMGLLVGPFASAALIASWGSSRAAFAVSLAVSAIVLVVILVFRDPMAEFAGPVGAAPRASASSGVLSTFWSRRDVMLRVGSGVAIVSAMRASRTAVVPLWAVHIGLGGAQTALLVGIAAAIDVLLFYPGGALMDRFGRLQVVAPALLGFAGAHVVLALSNLLPDDQVLWLAVSAFAMAACNGLTSGVVATVGADLADPADPAVFLGGWRVTTDLGTAGAPLLIAAVTAMTSLAVAVGLMALIGVCGAALLRIYLPRYLPRRGDEPRSDGAPT